MSRLVSLLLIFSLLLAQSLPHSHAGSSMDQPDDHDSRPHIHLSLHSHSHGHSHSEHRGRASCQHGNPEHSCAHAQDGAACLYGVNDHDDDAIYLAGSTLSLHRLIGKGLPTYFTSPVGNIPERFCLQQSFNRHALTPPLWRQPLPIYLLVAALRL